jgi:CTP:molybdopterin cytidylyltransferase MocA
MLDRLLELYRDWVSEVIVVVHPSFAGQVRDHARAIGAEIGFEVQTTPTGMLDAVLLAHDRVRRSDATRVWITWCDQVAIHPRTVARLGELSDAHPGTPLILPVAHRRHPYVHLERDASQRISRVLHRREGDALPEVGESELGLFSLSRDAYLERLPAFAASADAGSATGERNLLPFIPWIAARGEVLTFPGAEDIEAVGVNTPEELRQVEAHLAARERRVLSVVIPAYNEERFIGTLLRQIEAVDLSSLGVAKQIIVVDDCSKDQTADIVAGEPGVTLCRMAQNGGKGRAVRAGIEIATGDYLIIQDADLEYDPNDYVPMLRVLMSGAADVVYGSRYLESGKHPRQSWAAYLGGRSLSVVALACTGRYLTDTVTALKLFTRADIAALPLETTGFELDHEITARMLARRARIVEVPIAYHPRSREEGKKIGLRDWFIALRTFWRYGRTA